MCVLHSGPTRTKNLLVTYKGSIRAVHVDIHGTSLSGRLHRVVDINVEIVGGK